MDRTERVPQPPSVRMSRIERVALFLFLEALAVGVMMLLWRGLTWLAEP